MVGEQEKSGHLRRSVLIIVENLPVPFDRRVWQEATSLRKAGYTVTVICPKGKGYLKGYEELEGIHIYRHSLPLEASGPLGFLFEYSSALFCEFILSIKVFFRHGFDVIHACNPPDLIFLIGAFYKIFFRKRFLFDHHDINPELFEAKFGRRGFFHALLKVFERYTFFFADASIATNDTFKRIAVERGKMASDRVWVVKSYPDLKRFRRLPADDRLRKGFTSVVGYIGVIAKQDGVDLLLLAMNHLHRTLGRKDIGCFIIGDGPERANLMLQAQELGLQDHVMFPGYLTGDNLLTYLSTIDIGVIPDPLNEYNDKISMNKVFEYMALGIPIVQFDLAESRKTAGEAALIADGHSAEALAEAISKLIDDPNMREEMARYGKAHAQENFSWEKEQSKLLDAYDTLFSFDLRPSGSGSAADRTTADAS